MRDLYLGPGATWSGKNKTKKKNEDWLSIARPVEVLNTAVKIDFLPGSFPADVEVRPRLKKKSKSINKQIPFSDIRGDENLERYPKS